MNRHTEIECEESGGRLKGQEMDIVLRSSLIISKQKNMNRQEILLELA